MIYVYSTKELALIIIKKRKQLKLSQAMVAKRAGLRQQTISAFEKRPENTKLDTLFLILSAVELGLQVLSKTPMSDQKEWGEEW